MRSERLRPFPPELAPEEYLGSIEVGDCVEMMHIKGWWQMEVLANPLSAEAAAAEGGDAPHDPAAPSNLTKSDQLKELREKEQRLRPEPTPDEARAARLHVASVVFAAEHNDANFEVLRPVWVWKRKAGTQTKRIKGEGGKGEGGKGEGGKEEGPEEEGAGVRAFKEGDEIEGVWTKSRGREGRHPNPNPNPAPHPNPNPNPNPDPNPNPNPKPDPDQARVHGKKAQGRRPHRARQDAQPRVRAGRRGRAALR